MSLRSPLPAGRSRRTSHRDSVILAERMPGRVPHRALVECLVERLHVGRVEGLVRAPNDRGVLRLSHRSPLGATTPPSRLAALIVAIEDDLLTSEGARHRSYARQRLHHKGTSFLDGEHPASGGCPL